MNKMNFISLACSVLAFAGVVYLLTVEDEKKTAFFMSAEVYNDFDYKIELETELLSFEAYKNKKIDSLEQNLKFSMNYLKSIQPTQEQLFQYEYQQNNYLEFKQREEYAYSEKTQEYYGLIWDRINTYVQEYGKEKDYVYIFGANGDGSIMYANESEDITEEIKEFINQKYSGE